MTESPSETHPTLDGLDEDKSSLALDVATFWLYANQRKKALEQRDYELIKTTAEKIAQLVVREPDLLEQLKFMRCPYFDRAPIDVIHIQASKWLDDPENSDKIDSLNAILKNAVRGKEGFAEFAAGGKSGRKLEG